MNPHLHFFCGCDPAPSDGQNSDDGAIIIAAAQPKVIPGPEEMLSNQWSDWKFRPCYGRRLTSKEKASARQYSGVIHDLHRRFQFDKMVMDPNGGGIFVKRELIQPRQIIGGLETECRPIGDQVDGPMLVTDGDFILHLCGRGDPGVQLLWPILKGDDGLNQAIYAALKDGLDLGDTIELPPPIEAVLATQRDGFPHGSEIYWSLANLDAFTAQAQNVFQVMRPDGETAMTTRNGNLVFDCVGKKDLVSAMMYAWLAFLIWLAQGEFETDYAGSSAGSGFVGWSE